MSYLQKANLEPRRNIFNIFDKGKDFFLFRAILTMIAAISLIVGVVMLSKTAWEVYPTIIRDQKGNTFVGIGSTYKENPVEILRAVTSFVEAMFTKTEEGLALDEVKFIASDKALQEFLAVRERVSAFNQTANVFDFFIGPKNEEQMIVYTQLDILKASFNRVLTDTAYVALLMERVPRSYKNPSGWQIRSVEELSRNAFLEARKQYVKDNLNISAESNLISTVKEL